MNETEIFTTFEPSEVVIKSSDDFTASEQVETFSEVSADVSELEAIHAELTTIRQISLLLLVSFLIVFIFKFLFGQLASWFST